MLDLLMLFLPGVAFAGAVAYVWACSSLVSSPDRASGERL